jgi:hypothetical protein
MEIEQQQRVCDQRINQTTVTQLVNKVTASQDAQNCSLKPPVF